MLVYIYNNVYLLLHVPLFSTNWSYALDQCVAHNLWQLGSWYLFIIYVFATSSMGSAIRLLCILHTQCRGKCFGCNNILTFIGSQVVGMSTPSKQTFQTHTNKYMLSRLYTSDVYGSLCSSWPSSMSTICSVLKLFVISRYLHTSAKRMY